MAILGIETLTYCVDDMQKSVDFFEDFGLRVFESSPTRTHFRLPDNSNVIVRSIREAPVADPALGPIAADHGRRAAHPLRLSEASIGRERR